MLDVFSSFCWFWLIIIFWQLVEWRPNYLLSFQKWQKCVLNNHLNVSLIKCWQIVSWRQFFVRNCLFAKKDVFFVESLEEIECEGWRHQLSTKPSVQLLNNAICWLLTENVIWKYSSLFPFVFLLILMLFPKWQLKQTKWRLFAARKKKCNYFSKLWNILHSEKHSKYYWYLHIF